MIVEYYKGKFNYSDIKFGEFCIENQNRFFFCYGIKSKNFNNDSILRDLDSKDFCHDIWRKLFRNGYFIVIYDKISASISIWRDIAGLKSGYYYQNQERLIISTNMHQIAKLTKDTFSPLWLDSYVFNNFILDGNTFYENILEVNTGENLVFDLLTMHSVSNITPLPIAFQENELNEIDNIALLRNKTLEIFENLADENNVVYLSGGIDSCVILAALHIVAPSNTRCVSYCVKNGVQNESNYARLAADYLGTPIEIVEFDSQSVISIEKFESAILKQNLPYDGMFMFEPHKQQSNEFFFAGQDTRLHTPAVGTLEFALLKSIKNNSFSLNMHSDFLVHFMVELHKKGLNLSSIIPILCSHQNVLDYSTFSLSQSKYSKYGFDCRCLSELQSACSIDIIHKDSIRGLYNDVVAKRWKKQYTNDIRYMIDMGNRCQSSILLPFYEPDLAWVSSTLPWNLATKRIVGQDKYSQKKVTVDKYLLRKAFENEISDRVLYRAKATSDDAYMMYQGTIKHPILTVCEADINDSHSFLKKYGYDVYYKKYIKNDANWSLKYRSLKTALNLACCIILYNNSQL